MTQTTFPVSWSRNGVFAWELTEIVLCVIFSCALSLSHMVSQVKGGIWLYRFLIFAILFTFNFWISASLVNVMLFVAWWLFSKLTFLKTVSEWQTVLIKISRSKSWSKLFVKVFSRRQRSSLERTEQNRTNCLFDVNYTVSSQSNTIIISMSRKEIRCPTISGKYIVVYNMIKGHPSWPEVSPRANYFNIVFIKLPFAGWNSNRSHSMSCSHDATYNCTIRNWKLSVCTNNRSFVRYF